MTKCKKNSRALLVTKSSRPINLENRQAKIYMDFEHKSKDPTVHAIRIIKTTSMVTPILILNSA